MGPSKRGSDPVPTWTRTRRGFAGSGVVHLSAAGELNRVHTRNNKSPLRSLTLSISHLESFPPSSPLKFVFNGSTICLKINRVGGEGVRLEVSLTRAATRYGRTPYRAYTPNLAGPHHTFLPYRY